MEKSTVYFTDFRCPVGTSQLDKLKKLCVTAGIKDIDMDGKFVAIKMHFGELGNLAFLRPNYAKAVADLCKEQGGLPFLTDCNTLYPGSRKNALEHLECANLNGFNSISTGCQIIIGDGLRGTDEVEVPVVNGEYCQTALIGHAIMDADIFISLSHFKGHEATGFGGALKNIGMGCGSRAGKMKQHASGKPAVNEELCRGCRRCAKECGSDAITYPNKKAVIDYDKCKGCGRCIGACGFDAVYNPNSSANELLDRKMAEYAQAVCHGRPHFLFILGTQLAVFLVQLTLLCQNFRCILLLKSYLVISLLNTLIITFLSLKKSHTHNQYKKEQHTGHHIRIRPPDIKSALF